MDQTESESFWKALFEVHEAHSWKPTKQDLGPSQSAAEEAWETSTKEPNNVYN